MNTNVSWTAAYKSAVLEMDSSKLAEKAHLAEEAIFARLRTLPIGAHGERLAIQKAISGLRVLRRERLGNEA
jgi:hypothetical protein